MFGRTNSIILSNKTNNTGATVTAINKTGAIITSGSKVWLNENQQTQGSSYQIAANISDQYKGVISRSGNFGWVDNYLCSFGSDTSTKVSSLTANAACVKYGEDGSTFIMNNYTTCRIDENAQYTIKYRYMRGNYFINNVQKVVRVNTSDGSVIEELGGNINGSYVMIFVINDVFYQAAKSANKYIYNGTSYDQLSINITNGENFYPVDVTSDNRYVIGGTGAYFSNASNNCLRILEVIDEDNLKILTQSEMPAELQEFYSTPCNIVFNPYTSILTVTGYRTSSYAVMKYENGTWTPISVDLELGDLVVFGSLTLSDDLTKACYTTYDEGVTSTARSMIANLTSTSGYAAVPYRFYNMNENTITGYAGNDTEPDREVIVGVGSVPSVNNGG